MSGMRWKTLAVAVGMMASVACSGKGCSCTMPIKGGFAVAERHESAIQLRATQGLFKYFSDNGATLLPSLLPTGTTFNVPPTCGGNNPICCNTMPPPMCRINFDFKSLSLQPTAPNLIKLSTNLVLKTMDNLPVGILGGTCFISIDTTRTGGQTMNISADLAFPVNKTTDSTEISAMNAVVTGIDDGDLKTDEPGSTPFLCAALGLVRGFIISTLETQVATQIQDTISKQTCMTCMDKTDCNSFASDCVMGTCVQADGKTCVQEVGLDGRMDVGKSLAAFSPNTKAKMDVLAALGGYAKADTGLSLGMLGGGYADPHNACVAKRTRPAPALVKPSTTFTTDLLPDGATPYHLGIGVHKSHLDTLGFAAWDAGALCLDVGTPSVALLTAKTIGVVIPSLGDLVHGKDAPMFLVIRPQDPPTFTMGKGTFKIDMNGQKVIDDALLHIHVPNFNIDFFAFVDEHYVRIMTLTADLELPVALDVDATNKIVPLLGDLTQAFTNVSVTNSELLSESPADLAKTFPMLLGLAGGQLGSVLKPIALPVLMGINVKPIAITSTDPDADGANQYLSIFANLSTGTPLSLAAETEAKLVELTLPTTPEFAVDFRTAAQPTARLQLGGRSIDGLPLEFSFQVDESGWSPFSEATTLDLTHPLLWLQGRHQVDVRARAAGLPETLDRTPARVELLVDTIAPEGSFDGSRGELVVSATDRVSLKGALLYRWRVNGGEYSMWSALDHQAIDPAIPLDAVEVQARDEAGNIGTIRFHGRTTAPASSGCGCDVGGAAPAPTGGLLVILIGLTGLFVLRRRRLALFLLSTLCGLAGCNDGGLGKGEFVNNIDEIGRFHDVTARNGEFFVSAYDDSVGDLVYAHIKDLSKPVSWQDIDGVDLTAPVDTPGGYRHGISDPGPDVGLYTSIALTKAGAPRIAYYDITNAALKFAAGPGHFRVSTVETGAGGVKVGLYAALTIDDADVPSIAYMATGISDGKSGFKSELRVATATSANPGDADWTIQQGRLDRDPLRGPLRHRHGVRADRDDQHDAQRRPVDLDLRAGRRRAVRHRVRRHRSVHQGRMHRVPRHAESARSTRRHRAVHAGAARERRAQPGLLRSLARRPQARDRRSRRHLHRLDPRRRRSDHRRRSVLQRAGGHGRHVARRLRGRDQRSPPVQDRHRRRGHQDRRGDRRRRARRRAPPGRRWRRAGARRRQPTRRLPGSAGLRSPRGAPRRQLVDPHPGRHRRGRLRLVAAHHRRRRQAVPVAVRLRPRERLGRARHLPDYSAALTDEQR